MKCRWSLCLFSLFAAALLCAPRAYSQAISLFGGMSFSPSPLRVSEGKELQDPLTIRIVGTNGKGELVAAKDSGVPMEESFDPKTGKLGSKMYTHAISVVWQFTKAGITFRAEGVTYKAEKAGATISFTQNGVKMEGINTEKTEGSAGKGPSATSKKKGQDGSALMQAAKEGNVEKVKSLLAAGIPTDSRDTSGGTALMRASVEGRLEVVKLLLDKGADVNAKDNEGLTALRWTSFVKLPEKPNKDAGGMIEITDYRAAEKNEIAKLLRNRGAKE